MDFKKLIVFISIFTITLPTAEANSIRLNTRDLSLCLHIDEDGLLFLSYFGKKLKDTADYYNQVKTPIYLDYALKNEAYPAAGGRTFREPALQITHSDGDINTELVYKRSEYKYINENTEAVIVYLEDRKFPLEVKLYYKAFKQENVFTMSSEIINKEPKEIVLHNYYSFYLPVNANKYYLTQFYGSAAKEMSVEEHALTHGMKSIQSRKGVRTTHTENPSFLLSLNSPLEENSGEIIGGALAWSGNFKLNFELDEFNTLYLSAGINSYASEYHLLPDKSFYTPEMIFTYSVNGAGDISRNFHDWARKEGGLYNSHEIRPIVLNSWEGVYFSFDEEKLKKIIDGAAEIGVEMFVLDDGWFGNNFPRNNAKMGLGDWQVNKEKLPNGINGIADYTVSKGLKFGLWIEPEMVNPQSDLAKKHPDWIVKAEGRTVPLIRNQWLLDLCNPKVQDFIFQTFEQVLKLSDNISYIKWDANRHAQSIGSSWLPSNKQSHFWVEYIQGLYKVYERIRQKYPNIMIQACSSGGGRVDYGSLKYHNEFWASDNTDAYQRAFIQYGTNLIYPAIATGADVSNNPNRHTKRIIPFKFRVDMAMTGRMGFEMQPEDLDSSQRALAKEAVINYKKVRDIIQEGDLYRISSPYDKSGYYSIMYVTKDKKRAIFYAFCLDYNGIAITPTFKLNGLSDTKRYLIKELNSAKSILGANEKNIAGDSLIKEGININLRNSYESIVLYLESKD